MELFFLALLIVLMAGALASGFPVAFALPGSAILTILLATIAGSILAGDSGAYFSHGGPVEWLSAGVTNFRGIYWEVERDTLIAIPLFVFMGIMLQRSRIAEDLLLTMAQLFGPVRGGLGIAVVFVGALLAATTGILGATVVAMGLISLPAMVRNNYSVPLATGTIAASGTLGQIIPPSIVLIILADQLSSAVDQAATARQALYRQVTGSFALPSEFGVVSTSAGDMFLGALLPGLVLVGLFMVYILILAMARPKVAPPVPFQGELDVKLLVRVGVILVPPLTLIFAVLGSIIMGIATVNQAGAIGAVGAMIMAGYRLKEGQRGAFTPAIIAVVSLAALAIITQYFSTNVKSAKSSSDWIGIGLAAIAVLAFLTAVVWSGWRTFKIEDTLRGVMVETAKTTSLVFIILLGAAMLTAAFRAFGGEVLVKDFLTSLPGGFWAQFVIVMAVMFVLGFFLDFIEIAVVVVPIVAPILLMDPSANVTAVWLGVMIGLNIQTSFLTPPFGFALFYLRGVAPPSVRTLDIYKGVVPFIGLQLVALAIVGSFPPLVNYLPTRISLTSETAPPPINPRLQVCMERYLSERIATDGDRLRGAIAAARALPLDALPRRQQSSLTKALDQAEQVFDRIKAVEASTAQVDQATPAYAPLHRQVRAVESRLRDIDASLTSLRAARSRVRGDDQAERDRLAAEITALERRRDRLTASIPADWPQRRDAFAKIKRAETAARTAYRNGVDQAYEPIRETMTLLASAERLAAIDQRLGALIDKTTTTSPDQVVEGISQIAREVRAAKGAARIRSRLARARRYLRRRSPDPDKAAQALREARGALAKDIAWRRAGAEQVLPGLSAYEREIRQTIGLRQQPRLSRDAALYIAGCNSDHRDISLSF